jgi:HK97 family phage prohead protease
MDRATIALGEVKLAIDADAMTFEGYGAVFGNVDSYGDVIEPGAFAETLAASRKSGRWPVMLAQHGGMGFTADDMMPIGVWTDMAEDGKGLWVQGKLADTARGREAYSLLKMTPRPALDGLSIGYRAKKWTAGTKPTEPRRKLEAIDLFEISLVTMPANPKARIASVKSFDPRALEAELRNELNLSGSAAVKAVAILKKHLREGGGAPEDSAREAAAAAEVADAIRRNIHILTGAK